MKFLKNMLKKIKLKNIIKLVFKESVKELSKEEKKNV